MLQDRKVDCESENLFNLAMKYKKEGDFEKSIEYCKKSAELSNPKASFLMAMYYSEGIYLQSDRENIFSLYKQAADGNLAEAQKFTADHYFFGDGVEKDRQKAIQYYTMAAENGDVSSMQKLAGFYLKGEVVEKDEEKAVEYFKKASDKNFAIAQMEFGDYYLEKNDLENARKYYKKASDKDLAKAQIKLADLYMENAKDDSEFEKAFNYYKLAETSEFNRIDLGLYSIVSFYRGEYLKYKLAICYLDGKGVGKDIQTAKKYLEESAEFGYAPAIEVLQSIKEDSKIKDEAKARELFEDYENFMQQGEEDLAIDSLKKSAEKGYSKALNMLGGFCLSGNFIEKDSQKAMDYYKKSSENMDEIAQFILANHYADEKNSDFDLEKSMQYYKLNAKINSNSLSKYNVGVMYFEAKGVEKDYCMAAKYFEMAAKDEVEEAICALGNCYFNGLGVQKDSKKAVSLWNKAERMGFEGAKIHLASYYESLNTKEGDEKALYYHEQLAKDGIISSKYYLACNYEKKEEFEKAFELFKETADEGFSFSQDRLSSYYFKGICTDVDVKRGIFYLELASNQNHAIATLKLGDIYYNGEYLIPKDYEKAFFYYKSVEHQDKTSVNDGVNVFGIVHGTAEAKFKTGMCYYNGFGTQRDFEKAVECFDSSAKDGNVYAQNMLGCCYFEGFGVQKDSKKAVGYFTIASERDLTEAKKNLGICYIKGEGVKRDIKRAVEYFTEAAEKGDSYCQNILASMYFRGKLVEKDYSKVAYYYKMIAEKNNPEAMYILGLLHESGKGVEKDTNKARQYYQSAADLGMEKAREKLENMD